MSVVAQAAHFRTTEQQLPTERRNSYSAHLVAASGRVGGAGQQRHSTDAKGLDRNERPTQPRAERSERRQWHGHRAASLGCEAGTTEIIGICLTSVKSL